MVGFHVLNDQVIRLSVAKNLCKIVEPFMSEFSVHRIHNGDFFVHNGIRVICHSVGNNILTFKQIDLVVVHTYIFDIVGNLHIYSSC